MQMAPRDSTRAQSPEPLARLFEEYHGLVLATALRVTGSVQDAEDVLQTVFLRLARRGEPATPSGGYLRRAAINASIDLLRSRERAGAVPLDETGDDLADPQAPTPERSQQDRELRRELRRALLALPRKSAQVFVLRHFDGLSHREIAAALDVSRASAAVTLFRARRRLQTQLTQFGRATS